jgi:hypothetical protein
MLLHFDVLAWRPLAAPIGHTPTEPFYVLAAKPYPFHPSA